MSGRNDRNDIDRGENVKVVVVGHLNSGKTTLVNTLLGRAGDVPQPTVGASFRRHEGIDVWDTGGNPQYLPLLAVYTRGCHARVVVVDATNPSVSPEHFTESLEPTFVVATKCDLLDHHLPDHKILGGINPTQVKDGRVWRIGAGDTSSVQALFGRVEECARQFRLHQKHFPPEEETITLIDPPQPPSSSPSRMSCCRTM
jgi:small GTP-binding protein